LARQSRLGGHGRANSSGMAGTTLAIAVAIARPAMTTIQE
jgi:hypothetical protein